MVQSGERGSMLGGGMLLTGCNATGCYMHSVLRITPQGSGPLGPALLFGAPFLSLYPQNHPDILITLPQICPSPWHTFALNLAP